MKYFYNKRKRLKEWVKEYRNTWETIYFQYLLFNYLIYTFYELLFPPFFCQYFHRPLWCWNKTIAQGNIVLLYVLEHVHTHAHINSCTISSRFIDAKKPSSYILPKAFNIVLYHGVMKSKGCMLIGLNKSFL